MSTSAATQLEQFKRRVETLATRRTQVQVQLEAARQQHATAVQEATEAYGTAEVPALKALYAKQEAENAKALADFAGAIEEFEGYLTRIEAALANPEALAALVNSMPAENAEAPATEPSAAEARPVDFDEEDI